MSAPTAPARLFKPRDYLNTATHLALGAGVAVATGIWAGPVIAIGSAAALGIGGWVGIKYLGNLLPEALSTYTAPPPGSPHLMETTRDLAARTGFKSTPVLHDFKLNLDDIVTRADPESKIGKLAHEMETFTNAAAMNLGTPVVLCSSPLLGLLTEPEEKAVLAHEFTHAGARHSQLGSLVRWGLGAAKLSAGIVVLGAVCTTGLVPAAAILGGAAAAYDVAGKIFPPSTKKTRLPIPGKKAVSVSLLFEMCKSSQDRKIDDRRKLARSLAGTAALAGIAACFVAPWTIIGALAIRGAIGVSGSLINKNYTRRFEFQADRGSVALGADPLAMITALRKLIGVRKRDQPNGYALSDYHQGSLPSRLLKRVKTVTRTHPNTDRRIKRLVTIAARQGRSAAEIAVAVSGPLDLSGLPPSPPAAPKPVSPKPRFGGKPPTP